MNHTSEIKLQVELDENRIPERLFWEAPDGITRVRKPFG